MTCNNCRRVCVVCRWGVFRSQVIAGFLRKAGIAAEAYALEDKYVGKLPADIVPEIFSRIEEEFTIEFSKRTVKKLTPEDMKNCSLIILAEEGLKEMLPKEIKSLKVKTLKEIIGMEFGDLRGKSYEAHREFVEFIDKNLEKLIGFVKRETSSYTQRSSLSFE